MRAIVAGALANKPGNGGEAWVRLTWVLGLRRLGVDAHLVEVIDEDVLRHEDGCGAGLAASVNGRFFSEVVEAFGLAGAATLACRGSGETLGLGPADLLAMAGETDLLINLSGHLDDQALLGAPRRRVYVDLDPVYTQVWHMDGLLGDHLLRHDVHLTVGGNIGTPRCAVAVGGIRWIPVAPPVLMEEWPLLPGGDDGPFTTVASWRGGHGTVEVGGVALGPKAHEFRRILGLPRDVARTLEIALDIHPGDDADRRALEDAGWRLREPREVAATPGAFREYVRASFGEMSAAQGAYVRTGSGWLSDRTAHYLASGRPAVVQDTGAAIPSGEGLMTFRTAAEAAAAAGELEREPARHREAARALAERLFDSDRVLARVLEVVGAGR